MSTGGHRPKRARRARRIRILARVEDAGLALTGWRRRVGFAVAGPGLRGRITITPGHPAGCGRRITIACGRPAGCGRRVTIACGRPAGCGRSPRAAWPPAGAAARLGDVLRSPELLFKLLVTVLELLDHS
ncbi:MAG TPA: hypothetical protein VNA86_06385, partial [bacterium]|nr:hypothetical protein [bacterium]